MTELTQEQMADSFREDVSCPDLMIKVVTARQRRDEMKGLLKEQQQDLDDLELELIDAMKKSNQKSIKRDDGVHFIHIKKKQFTVKADRKGEQRAYCQANDMDEMLSVNFQTWNGYCKELDEAGEKLPDFTEVYEKDGLTVRGLAGLKP